jgi:hypothetical protein
VAVVAHAAVALPAGAKAEAPRPAAPDLTTPRGAVAAVVRAMEQGDADALAAAITGSEAERAWARAQASQRKGLRSLHEALVKRFGKEYAEGEAGHELREQIAALRDDDLLTDLKKAKHSAPRGGEVMLIVDEGTPDDRQPRLVRAEGRWKLDLSSLSDYFDPKEAPALQAEAKAATKLAADVAAGKFADLEAAAGATDQAFAAAAEGDAPKAKPAGARK